jgi:hypothetical protein
VRTTRGLSRVWDRPKSSRLTAGILASMSASPMKQAVTSVPSPAGWSVERLASRSAEKSSCARSTCSDPIGSHHDSAWSRRRGTSSHGRDQRCSRGAVRQAGVEAAGWWSVNIREGAYCLPSSGFATKETRGRRKWAFGAGHGDRSGEVKLRAPRKNRSRDGRRSDEVPEVPTFRLARREPDRVVRVAALDRRDRVDRPPGHE